MIQEDFEQHVVKLQNALLGFAKSLTHNEDEAKDLLQETSLKALSNKAMYDDSGSIFFYNRCSTYYGFVVY